MRFRSSPPGAFDGSNHFAERRLTKRQLEVLSMLAAGLAPKQIAFRLNLSVKTVETHKARVVQRLGIRDLDGLTRYAQRLGLVHEDPPN